jgi:hypothetical protein
MKVQVINPRSNARFEIDLQLTEAVMRAAKTDLAVSNFVAELARDTHQIPEGFMLVGDGFRTP